MTLANRHGRTTTRLLLCLAALLGGAQSAPAARAGVVVIGNHTEAAVDFLLTPAGGPSQPHTVAPTEVLPLRVAGRAEVSFASGDRRRRSPVDVPSAHYFTGEGADLRLHQVVSAASPAEDEGARDADTPRGNADLRGDGVLDFYRMGVIPIMLVVDDEQQLVARKYWEPRLRKRIEMASDVFHRHCGFRFRTVKVGTWDSQDGVRQFTDALREFEQEVIPDPAPLALGFTSQQYYIKRRRDPQIGGATRGPLARHVLIRESNRRMTERERVEVVLHELAHVLGAVHSPHGYSAMRPSLGDGRARERSFRIGFDPGNTLVMCLVASELRTGRVRAFSQLGGQTKRQLRTVYTAMAEEMPDDGTARNAVALLDRLTPPPVELPDATVAAARRVVEAIARAAAERVESAAPPTGDALTEHYVRRAAEAASKAAADAVAPGFLFGLAIGLDDSPLLRGDPLLGPLCRQVESDDDWRRRVEALGTPTMRGRGELAHRFVLACGLTVMLGPEAARGVGRRRELADCRRGGAFRFVHLLAHDAGMAFAERVASGRLGPAALAESFRVDDFVPDLEAVEEALDGELQRGLSWKAFLKRYGSLQDDRFRRRQAILQEQIAALPAYR